MASTTKFSLEWNVATLSSQGVTIVSVIDSGVTSLLLPSGWDSGRQLAA